MSSLDSIFAVPAHAPRDADAAALTAKIIAHQASESAMYFAARMDAQYHNFLTRLDLLVSLGMLDAEYADSVQQGARTAFYGALDAITNRRVSDELAKHARD